MGLFGAIVVENRVSPGITDYRLRITNYELRITDYGLRITDWLQAADSCFVMEVLCLGPFKLTVHKPVGRPMR
jgi:hypothetical protein